MASEGDLVAGKYRLERFLGSGGFASVWAARNELIDRPIALKVLADTYARRTEIVQRFLREARIACRLIHPAVLRVEDVGQTESGTPFLVMELLEGRPLSRVLKGRRALPLPVAVGVLRHVLEGLAAAHDKGIIHRDVKPSNVFVMEPGTPPPPVRILDLGVAKDLGEDEQLTTTGQLIGTPSYLAPEIMMGGDSAAWTKAVDVFACGMVLFVAVTGRLPFDEDTRRPSHVRVAERVLYYRAAAALPRASAFAPDLPPAVDEVIARSLAIRPADRYADARQMLEALDAATVDLPGADPSALAARAEEPTIDELETAIVAGDEAKTTVTPPSFAPAPAARRAPPSPAPEPRPSSDGPAKGALPSPQALAPSASGAPLSAHASGPPSAAHTSGAPPASGVSGPPPAHVPSAPAAGGARPAGSAGEPAAPEEWAVDLSDASEPRPRASRAWLVGAGAAVLALAVLGAALAWLLPGRGGGGAAATGGTGPGVAAARPDGGGASLNPSKTLDAAEPAATPRDAGTAAADAAPPGLAQPSLARVRLVGLPPRAAVTFDGAPVDPEAGLEGLAGRQGDLRVVAPGHAPYGQRVTLADGLEVDLTEATRAARLPTRPAGPAKRTPPFREPATIEGRQPGSKIKILSHPPF